MKSKLGLGLLGAGAALGISLGAVLAPAPAAPSKDGAAGPEGRALNRYVVIFEDSVEHPGAIARTQVEQRGGRLGFIYRYALKGYSAQLPKQSIEGLRRDPRIELVAPDRWVEPLDQSTPTGIDRVFATANETLQINETEDLKVNADIAVIDTGIDHTHPDLNVVKRTDCSVTIKEEEEKVKVKCKDDMGTDDNDHGTHVAGTAAARDNGAGVVGVAPGARLWAVKVLRASGGGWESGIAAGVDWVTGHAKEIEVANMSIGDDKNPWPLTEAAIEGSVEEGIVYVAAAGNEKIDASESTPGNQPDVITVSALADFDGEDGGKETGKSSCRTAYEGKHGAHADDSFAKLSNYGADVEVVAPGVCILSTVPGGKYEEHEWWGTSMATAHVSGAAAILASVSNPETKTDVESIRQLIAGDSSCPEDVGYGNCNWTDTSGDGVKEPLLDVGNEGIFAPRVATGVNPPDMQVTATLQAGTWSSFYLGNGYFPAFLACEESEVVFSTPPGGMENRWANTNLPNTDPGSDIGSDLPETNSQGSGGIGMQVDEVSFGECGLYFSETQGDEEPELLAEAFVDTGDGWSLSAEAFGEGEGEGADDGAVAVGVPGGGASASIGIGCEVLLAPDGQGVVFGRYDNQSQTLSVDGQVAMEGVDPPCDELFPVVQVEALYEVDSGFSIDP